MELITNEISSKETPRQRLMRFNKQIKILQEKYGYNPKLCNQPICTICTHLKCYKDYEGFYDSDCEARAARWDDGDDDIQHCKQFKAIKDWRTHILDILSNGLYWYCDKLASCEKQVEAGYIPKEEYQLAVEVAAERAKEIATIGSKLLKTERKLRELKANSIPKDRVREIFALVENTLLEIGVKDAIIFANPKWLALRRKYLGES